MQDKTTYPGIAKTLDHVAELADYLSSFLQNVDADGLNLDEIERLHLYLKTADLITLDPTSNKTEVPPTGGTSRGCILFPMR